MESPGPVFSVLVSTFNRPALVVEALNSVRAQTVGDFECIVVNDGETPVDLPDDPRFMLVEKGTGAGMGAALNTALDRARGRYLTFLDDDDLYTPRRLHWGLEGMAAAPLSICWRANPATGRAGRNRRLEGWAHGELFERPPPLLGQVTVERELAPRFETRLRHATDIEWLLRATKLLPISTVPKVGFLFRRHDERQSTRPDLRFVNRVRIYEWHRDYFDAHPRAAARFHRRTGAFARDAGLHDEARKYFALALRARKRPREFYLWATQLGKANGGSEDRSVLAGGTRPKHPGH